MAGYTRQDTTNNIADGNIIDAADLDNEYNAVEAAFNNTTGHTHDGTAAEGAPITKVGPAQDVVISASAVTPKTDNQVDLGSGSLEFKDLYIDGTANIDSLVADTADINGGTVDASVIGGTTPAAGTFTTATATTGNITTVNATTVDTTNLEVTNLKAKDGTAAGSIADSTGVVTLNSSVLTTADINGGTIDNSTIATSNITVGAGKTLNVSAGTLTLANDQISGDKVEGGTISATTITTLTSTTGNITNVNATTVDATNVEVTNLKAKDGTTAATIADSTGVITIPSSVLTSTDINGGTIDGTTIGGTTPAAGTFTQVNFADNAKAIFGAGSDLQIYHDGSHSYVSDQGTGNLRVLAANFQVRNAANNAAMITAADGGSVYLFDNGSQKLVTTSTGIDVTGTVVADGLTINNTAPYITFKDTDTTDNVTGYLDFRTSADVQKGFVGFNGAGDFELNNLNNNGINFSTTNVKRMDINSIGDISFYEDTGTTAKFFWDASAESLGIGNTAPASKLDIGTTSDSAAVLASFRANGFTTRLEHIGVGSHLYTGGSSAYLALGTNSTDRLTITSNGLVGIGTDSPTDKLTVAGSVLLSTAASFKITGSDSTTSQAVFRAYRGGAGDQTGGYAGFRTVGDGANGVAAFLFDVDTSEKMRIDSSGNLLVGTSSALSNVAKVQISGGSGSTITSETTGTGATDHVNFRNANGKVGTITTNGSSTSYNTSSDYRLKEDWVSVADASTRVNALKPVNFAWKLDGKRVDGFLAHELAEVVPEAVTGEKDAVDAEGNPEYQGIDQSKLVPLLTAALQEALAKIEDLTARVSALEGN